MDTTVRMTDQQLHAISFRILADSINTWQETLDTLDLHMTMMGTGGAMILGGDGNAIDEARGSYDGTQPGSAVPALPAKQRLTIAGGPQPTCRILAEEPPSSSLVYFIVSSRAAALHNHLRIGGIVWNRRSRVSNYSNWQPEDDNDLWKNASQ